MQTSHTLHLPKKNASAPKKAAPAVQNQAPQRRAMSQELVKLKSGIAFVLIFGCPRKYVPEGIQVISAGYKGPTTAPQDEPSGTRFSKAKVDLGGLLSRCVVDSVNVRESGGYCRVYVNCTVGVSETPGLHYWTGVYASFVQKALAHSWGRAVLKEQDGRVSLELRDMRSDEAAAKIRFAIEPAAS